MMLPLNAHSSPVHRKTLRALVVDDEPVVCESCRRILIGQGFQVETSTDSSTGLRLAELNEYDVILLDIRMPFIDGVRFLERLRQVRPVVPVIVITGHAADAYTRAAYRLGICECIAKPFTPAEIAQAVHRSLGHADPSSDPSEITSADAPDPPGLSRPSWQ
jgi:DNA-binding NtrC family response regulator